MRRGCSIVLFVIGGWLLSSVAIIGLIQPGDDFSRWAALAVFVVFAAPFLIAATWISPGRRLAELGLTLMITAGAAAGMVISMAAVFFDPAMKRFMPPQIYEFDFTSPAMIASILVMGGSGFLLWRTRTRA